VPSDTPSNLDLLTQTLNGSNLDRPYLSTTATTLRNWHTLSAIVTVGKHNTVDELGHDPEHPEVVGTVDMSTPHHCTMRKGGYNYTL